MSWRPYVGAFDPRIVQVSIDVSGGTKLYTGLNIVATGMKYTNANQNEAEITIYNLDKATQDYILTETSPYNLNRLPKNATLYAGRESYGVSQIFTGNILYSRPSQPPDIGVTLCCLTGNYFKGFVIARNTPAITSLKKIADNIASSLNLTLVFQTEDQNIANYTFTGGALKQISALNDVSGINAFVDDASLIIKRIGVPLPNATTNINLKTGMIGIPELTERGIKVRSLLDNTTRLGGLLEVTSEIYSAANGSYNIYQLGFEISNREPPFYWVSYGQRIIV